MKCLRCGTEIRYSVRYCPNCGNEMPLESLKTTLETDRPRWSVLLVTSIIALAILAIGIIFLMIKDLRSRTDGEVPVLSQSSTPVGVETSLPTSVADQTVTPNGLLDEEFQTATLPSPLAGIDFPVESIEYPPQWPIELRFPREFTLLETTSGMSFDSRSTGWAAKLRYTGPPDYAADSLSSFFTSKGWQIIDRIQLDSDGILLFLDRSEGSDTGSAVIDPNPENPLESRIMVTVFP